MLKRFKGDASSGPAADAPRVVKFWGDPTLMSLAARAQVEEWVALEPLLGGMANLEQRDLCIEAIAHEIDGRPLWIDGWVSRRPGAYLPVVFRGRHSVDWAWQARGGKRAREVTDQAFRLFAYRLGLARQDLEAAAEMAPPGDAGALVPQIPMGMGLGYDKPEIMRIWRQIQDRQPWHQGAVYSMVMALAPKWSGSLPRMFDFARSTAAAPEGSGAHLALVYAHHEACMQEGSNMYWRLPGVREDILGAAERSIESRASVPSPVSLRDHNWFMYAFGRLREWDRFRRELEIVQGRFTTPWSWFNNPVAVYEEIRAEMAAATGRPTARG
jgi:hypothetical protein